MFVAVFLAIYFTSLLSVLVTVARRDVREWDAAHTTVRPLADVLAEHMAKVRAERAS